MAAMLRRLPPLAALAALAGIGAEFLGHCAFTRLVRRDVEALRDGACTARAGVVTEEMLCDVPEPVRRYLTCTGVAGRPFVRMVRLRQKGAMRPGPGPPVDAACCGGPLLRGPARFRLGWHTAPGPGPGGAGA